MTLRPPPFGQALNQRRYFFLFLAASLLWSGRLEAGSATWGLDPRSGDWNDLQNWMPATVPNGPAEAATFAASAVTGLAISTDTEVDGILFTATASAYTITVNPALTLTLSGTGITNDSGIRQTFVADANGNGHSGTIAFSFRAVVGSSAMFTAKGASVGDVTGAKGGLITFLDNFGAGAGTFTLNGGAVRGANGGFMEFYNGSTAGNGIFINEGGAVIEANGGFMGFHDISTAGHATFFNNGGLGNGSTFGARGAEMIFYDNAMAGAASFTNNGGEGNGGVGAKIRFHDSSTASNATITNNGGTDSRTTGGFTGFYANSSAGNATVINNGSALAAFNGGNILFADESTAGNATLIANGGLGDGHKGGEIVFQQDSTGGTARVEVYGNGDLDISPHDDRGVTIGSLKGTGNVFLGTNNLTVGSNNLGTVFSGIIQDGGDFDGSGGSFTKRGTGTLTLSGANTYTGPTTVDAGRLIVNGSLTSAVTVNGGTLGGSGATRAVAVNSSGTLSPGTSAGILSVVGNLTLTLGATYLVDLTGTALGTQYDQTSVTGAVSLGEAALLLNLAFTPASGDQFMIISNDLSDPVTGTFGGLPEGATFTEGGQSFAVSYQGGDGNDVVLTSVIPEPATWVLASVALALLAAAMRGRRRSSHPRNPCHPR